MKRFVAIILSAALLVLSAGFTAFADDEYVFTYTVDNGEATITGVTTIPGDATEIVIPEYVSDGTNNYTVTSIKADAFNGNASLTGTLVLPATLKSVGNNAFKDCDGITSVIVEDGAAITFGTAVFQNSEGIKYVKFPKGTNITGANNIFNGAIKSTDPLVEIEEGVAALPYQAFRQCESLANLVLPSTVADIRLAAFFRTPYLEELYLLAESVTFSGTDSFDISVNKNTAIGLNPVTGNAGRGMGALTTAGSTKIYVVNNTVKQALLDKGWPLADRIEVMAYKTAFFYDSFETPVKVADEDADGYITLPTPAGREGYKFLYWDINGAKYFPGESYNITKSIAVSGKWVKDTEEKTVLYRNVSSNSETNEFADAKIGRIVCKALANKAVTLTFTYAGSSTVTKTAIFDNDGVWVNFDDNTLYKKVVMPSGYDYSELYILAKADDGFDADILLREPEIIAMPKLGGETDLTKFTWTSSNPTVVSVADGVVTGLASGTASITVSYGDDIYTFDVEASGEMAIAVKNNKEAEYLEDKKLVFQAINNAIKNEDVTAMKNVLTSTGTSSLSYIKDIDTSTVPADDAVLTELAKRLITYGEFDFSTTGKVSDFIKTFATEIVVGEINGLATVEEVELAFNSNNNYYNLPLKNEYYLKHKNDVLNTFVGYTAVNAAGLKADFAESYVMTAVNKAVTDSGYTVLRATIEGCASEIGYNQTHYNTINTAAFHKAMLTDIQNGKVTSMDSLKNYIDTSAGVTESVPSPGPGGGGGGGGGGSRPVITPASPSSGDVTFVTSDDYEEIMDENLPQDTSSVFADIETDRWSYQAIQYLVAKDIISGYEDGSFKPQNRITRAEFIRIISNAFGFEYSQAEGENTFADISESDWYYKDVIAAYNNKIVYGDNYGQFNPNAEISRQEMAAMLYRAIVASNAELVSANGVNITDKGTIADWAYTPVIQLVSMNVISGYEDGTFRPDNKATREEVAKMIYGVAVRLGSSKGAE